MAVVGELYVEFKADLTNLESGFASAKAQGDSFSAQAGESLGSIGSEASKAGAEVAGLGDESKKTGEKVSGAGKQGADGIGLIADALIAVGAVKAFEKIYDGFKKCIDASVELESALAGVAKTTDLTDQELSGMDSSARKLSTEMPAAATEILGVAEAAGQLGVTGSENILEFSKTMTMLGTATNMTADQGATMLAQFANITQMPTGEYSNLGSTIVALGNSTATTESKITEMSQGMAASATNAGIAEPAILAMAAATASVGIEAEAGSTSWSKFIQEMQKAVETGEDLDQWATVANMSASEFAKLWGQDAAQAINVWIQGLGNAAAQGQSMTGILEGLNITEVRQTRMLQSLANSGDLLTNALATGNQAWKQNTALQKEAATRYATTESKAKMLENRQKNLAATVGDQLNPLYSNLLDIGTDVTDFFQEMFEQNELLGPALASVAVGATVAGGAFLVYTAGAKVAEVAQKAFNAAMGANPIFLVITGITAGIAALAAFSLSLAEADAETQALNAETESLLTTMEDNVTASQGIQTQFDGQAKTTENLTSRLFELQSAANLTQAEQIEMGNAVAQLNTLYPDLSLQMDTTRDANGNLTVSLKDSNGELYKNEDALRAVTDQMLEMQEAEAKQAAVTQLYQDRNDAMVQLATTQAKSSGILNQYNAEQKEAIKQLGNMTSTAGSTTDVVSKLVMFFGGMDEETRNSIESLNKLSDGEKDLQEQISETENAIKSITGKEEILAAVTDETTGAIKYFKGANGDLYNALGELLPSLDDLKEKYNENRKAYSDAGISLDEFTEATLGMTDAEVALYEQEVLMGNQYDTLLEKYGTLGITRDEYIAQTAGLNEAQLAEYNNGLLIEAAMATQEERYRTLYDAALESLQGQYELWDTLDNEVTISAETIANATASQKESYDNYIANLESLQNRGVSAAQLLAMGFGEYSEEGAQALAGLAAASDTDLSKAIGNFESAGESSGILAGALADLNIAADTEMSGAGQSTNTFATEHKESMDTVSEATAETKDSVSGDLKAMDSDVKSTMDNIKSYVDDLNSTMPEITFKVNQDIPLPHFSMSGAFNAQTGGVPSFGVNWYDTGGVFTTPQVIGIAEKRPEFVGASADLESFIGKAVDRAFNNSNAIVSDGGSNVDIHVTMPMTVTKSLTDAEITRKSKTIVSIVGREFARATGGRMS